MRRPPAETHWSLTEWLFFFAFLFWSALGLIFTFGRLTPVFFSRFHLPQGIEDFIDLCIQNGDVILIILASFNTHLHAARQWSSGVARRWAFTIVLCAYLIETAGTLTTIPFGDYRYTDKFGPTLWPGAALLTVPITIPLAWHVVVTNALFIVRSLAPHFSGFAEAICAGAICTAYDFVLEPFATKVKGYWIWNGGAVPLLNYVSWFALSALLIWLFAPRFSSRFRHDIRPWVILASTVLIFLAGEFAQRFYR
jgi:uncharacterized membrane protein